MGRTRLVPLSQIEAELSQALDLDDDETIKQISGPRNGTVKIYVGDS